MQRIGAPRMASEILRPNVVSVLDVMLREPGAIRVQEITVGAKWAGQRLIDLRLYEQTGITVFAMREAGSLRHSFNPPPERVLLTGDVLIGCSTPDQLEAARGIAAGD